MRNILRYVFLSSLIGVFTTSCKNPVPENSSLAGLDPRTEVRFTVNSSTPTEGTGAVNVSVELAEPVADPVSVDVSVVVAGTTAESGTDYVIATGTVAFPALDQGPYNAVINLPAEAALYEGAEVLVLELTNATPVLSVRAGNSNYFMTIQDTDSAPTISFAGAPTSVDEDVAGATYSRNVNLNIATENDLTVSYGTTDGTASAGSDYTAASGTLTFSGGSTSETINVTIIDDGDVDPGETFDLTLSSPSAGTISNSPQTVTITDDDIPDHMSVTNTDGLAVAGGTEVLTLQLVDQAGSPISSAASVTVSVDGNAVFSGNDIGGANGSNTLVGTLSATGTGSVTITNNTAQGVSVSADAVGDAEVVANVSAGVTFSEGLASQLAFATQPSSVASAGTSFATQPVVRIEDSFGNLTANSDIISFSAWTSSDCTTTAATGNLNGASGTAATSGTATFSAVNYEKAEVIYLKAEGGGFTFACSNAITVNPGAASQLAFATQPSSAGTAGVNLTQQPVVEIHDAYGNLVTSAGDNILLTAHTDVSCFIAALGTANNNGPLGASSGVSTFTSFNYEKAETIYLEASGGGFTEACSDPVTISPNTASTLVFDTQPSSVAVAGVDLAQQPIVRIEDDYGNLTSNTDSISFTAWESADCSTTAASGTLNGSAGTAAVAGQATFTSVNYTKSETIYLKADGGGFTDDCSTGVAVSAGTADHLEVTATDGTASADGVDLEAFNLQLKDQYGNNVSSANSINVTVTGSADIFTTSLSSPSGVPGAAISGNLDASGYGTVSVRNAVAETVTVTADDPVAPEVTINVTDDVDFINGALWTGADFAVNSNWSNPLNWSGSAVPTGSEIATFDGSCVSCNVFIDSAAPVKGIDIQAGYTGTITQASTPLNIGSDGFTMAAGTFVGSASAGPITISTDGDFNLSGGSFTSTFDYLSIEGDIQITGGSFNANGGTVKLIGMNDRSINPGAAAFNNVDVEFGNGISGSTATLASNWDIDGDLHLNTHGGAFAEEFKGVYLIHLSGNLIVNNFGGVGDYSEAVIRFDGSGFQSISYTGGQMPSIAMLSSGTVDFTGQNLVIDGGYAHGSGTIITSSSTVEFRSETDFTIVAGSTIFNNVDLEFGNGASPVTMTLSGSLPIQGDLYINTDPAGPSEQIVGADILVEGDVTVSNLNGGTAGMNFMGAADQYLSITGGDFLDGTIQVNKAGEAEVIQITNLSLDGAGQDLLINDGGWKVTGSSVLTVADQLDVGDGGGLDARLFEDCGSIVPTPSSVNGTDGMFFEDDGGTPNLSVADVSVSEGGTLNFLIKLDSLECGSSVNITYQTNDKIAELADSDYTDNDSSTAIAAGMVDVTVAVSTTIDANFEFDETLEFLITSAPEATIIDGTAIGTIVNDDDNGCLWRGNVSNDMGNPANWTGGCALNTGDILAFDGTCTNCDPATNANLNVKGIWIFPSADGVVTVNQSFGNTINLGDDGFVQVGGVFNGGDSSIQITDGIFYLEDGTFNSTSADIVIEPTLGMSVFEYGTSATFNAGFGTLKVNSLSSVGGETYSFHVDQPINFYHFELTRQSGVGTVSYDLGGNNIEVDNDFLMRSWSSGNLEVNNGMLNVKGDVEAGIGAEGGDAILRINGIGNQQYILSGAGSRWFPEIWMDKPSNSFDAASSDLHVAGLHLIDGTFNAPSGVLKVRKDSAGDLFVREPGAIFNAGGGTVRFESDIPTGTHNIDTNGGVSFNNLEFIKQAISGTSSFNFSGDILVVNGDLLIDRNIGVGELWIDNGQINIRGNIDIFDAASGGNADILVEGSNLQTISFESGSSNLPGTITVSKTGGDITQISDVYFTTPGQNIDILDGDWKMDGYDMYVHGSSTITLGGNAGGAGDLYNENCEGIFGGPLPDDAAVDGNWHVSGENPIIDISDETENEGTDLVFTVTLTEPVCSVATTVTYNTADNTATSGSDYAPLSTTLNIAAGDTTGTITVTAGADDANWEPDEDFLVELTATDQGTLASGNPTQGTGTILNNEAPEIETVSCPRVAYEDEAVECKASSTRWTISEFWVDTTNTCTGLLVGSDGVVSGTLNLDDSTDHCEIHFRLDDGSNGSSQIWKHQFRVHGDYEITQVELGNFHACAIKDGDAYCWGKDGPYGALGINNGSGQYDVAQQVDLGTFWGVAAGSIRDLAAGEDFACARASNGEVACWGHNNWGRTGLGVSSGSQPAPSRVSSLVNVWTVEAGLDHACALLKGTNESNRGGVQCWGRDSNGKLGINGGSGSIDTPQQVLDDSYAPLFGAVEISLGNEHSCALMSNGGVKCWGAGAGGKLGQNDGNTSNSLVAIDVYGFGSAPGQERVISISASDYSTCAIVESGAVKCWGYGTYGQLGTENGTANIGVAAGDMASLAVAPIDMGPPTTRSLFVDGGIHNYCVVADNDKAYCWGRNNMGQLGLGDMVDRGASVSSMGVNLPYVDLGTGHSARDIKTSDHFACAITEDAANDEYVKCWGQNQYDRLGITGGVLIGDDGADMGDNLVAVNFGGGGTYKIFITNTGHSGNLGGTAGANAICDGIESGAVALISDSGQDIASVIGGFPSAPVHNMNGEQVVSDVLNLFAGPLDNHIGYQHSGTPMAGHYIFTGSTAGGLATANHCSNWLSTGGTATYGDPNSTSTTFNFSATGCTFGGTMQIACITSSPTP